MTKIHNTFNPTEGTTETKELTPIKFTKYINSDRDAFEQVGIQPNKWDNIKPIKLTGNNYVFLCWDKNEEDNIHLYSGELNDGVV